MGWEGEQGEGDGVGALGQGGPGQGRGEGGQQQAGDTACFRDCQTDGRMTARPGGRLGTGWGGMETEIRR